MDIWVLGLLAGALFLLIAIVGGGFTIRELQIPRVPQVARIASVFVGLLFIGLPLIYSLSDRPSNDIKPVNPTPAPVVAATAVPPPLPTPTPAVIATTTPASTLTPLPTPAPARTLPPTPISRPTPTLVSAPTLVPASGFQDDFSDPKSGWPEQRRSDDERAYVAGEYRVVVKRTAHAVTPTIARSFSDLDMQVKARYQGAALGKNYGLVFRFEDADNYYNFRVAPGSGKYTFYKKDHGEFARLVPWTPSPHINRGNTHNLLRVVARGPKFELYVNGILLDTVTDGTFSLGRIGLRVDNEDDPEGAEIYFDDLKVQDLK